jgi:hypothetical protein
LGCPPWLPPISFPFPLLPLLPSSVLRERERVWGDESRRGVVKVSGVLRCGDVGHWLMSGTKGKWSLIAQLCMVRVLVDYLVSLSDYSSKLDSN